MPAKPGKSAKDVNRAYSVFVGGMTGPKTKAAITKVMVVGMTYAKDHAPVEYSTLINSAYRRTEGSAPDFMGVCGFAGGASDKGFNYALYLHEKKNWSPRSPNRKSGPAWNPNATSNYLADGFTLPKQKTMINKVLGSEYKI